MTSLLLKAQNPEDLDIIRQLALKLGLEATELSETDLEDLEDAALLRAMDEDMSEEYVSREEVMKTLRKREG